MRRREFVLSTLAAAAGAAAGRGMAATTPKFGHRQANMVNEPGTSVFDLASKIRGLSGVELQVFFKGTSLWDKDLLLNYQKAAQRTGLVIPSLAGVWPPGATLLQPTAEEHIRNAIECAETVRARTILVAAFVENCPKMDQEQSYGPVVTMLQKVSGAARDAGVVVGMETSNSPAEDRKLIDLVDRPNVRVYYDLFNVEDYKHTHEAVPGIALLKYRIRQVHMKNKDRLLEQPGPVDFAAAARALAAINYPGWVVFETSHSSPEQCVEATEKNIAFITRNFGA
jgi:sugar phosphate isomerase/epimerase